MVNKLGGDPTGFSVWVRRSLRIETDEDKPELVKRNHQKLTQLRSQLGLTDQYGDSYFDNKYREF